MMITAMALVQISQEKREMYLSIRNDHLAAFSYDEHFLQQQRLYLTSLFPSVVCSADNTRACISQRFQSDLSADCLCFNFAH